MSTVDSKRPPLVFEPWWGGAYRAAGGSIATFAKKVLWVSGLPAVAVYKMARHYTVVDVASAITLRKMNRVCESWTGSPLSQTVTTAAQDHYSREEKRLKAELGPHHVYPQFSTFTSRYIHAFVHRLLVDIASAPPTRAERSLTQRMLCKLPLADIVDDAALKSAINFESLLLHICLQLKPFTSSNCTTQLLEGAIQSLGFSLGQQSKLDIYLKEHFAQNTPEEQYIARIRWHEDNGSLPRGIPRSEGLTPDNLRSKLDSALKAYLEERMEQLLAYLIPESLKTGTAGFYYKHWGKDQLRGLLVYLFDQFVLKPIIDPYTCSQNILKILGEEISDNDVNGYGRGQKKKVLETGLKMASGALNNHPQFTSIFASSQLKASPMGAEAIEQKNDTRARLQACLAKLIYTKLKPEEYQHHDEWFKSTRAALNGVPVAETVATGLHFACRTPFFALSYCFREAKQGDSFIEWMTRHIVGQKTAKSIAKHIVDLIHHPSWRFTAMHLIEASISTLMFPKPQGQPIGDEMHLITKFLLNHFKIPLPFDERMLSDLAANGIRGPFFQNLFPKTPLLSKLLQPLQPIIKELHLVQRILAAARKLESFDGDFTFWNVYVREVLNQQVASRVRTSEPPTLSYIADIRETLVNQYLQMDDHALWTHLSQHPPYMDIRQWTEIVQARTPLVELSTGFCFLNPHSEPRPAGTEPMTASAKFTPPACGVDQK